MPPLIRKLSEHPQPMLFYICSLWTSILQLSVALHASKTRPCSHSTHHLVLNDSFSRLSMTLMIAPYHSMTNHVILMTQFLFFSLLLSTFFFDLSYLVLSRRTAVQYLVFYPTFTTRYKSIAELRYRVPLSRSCFVFVNHPEFQLIYIPF